MSEFQVYQFQSVDRPLTAKERKAIGSWSSRVTPTATSATFTYSYGDFPKNKQTVVEKYFDGMLYFSNWGTKTLIFRFPLDSIDPKEIEQYVIIASDYMEVHLDLFRKPNCYLLEFTWSEEEGYDGYWVDHDDFLLGDLMPIREGIMNTDYRALYIFWLKIAQLKVEGIEEDEEAYLNPNDEFEEAITPFQQKAPIPKNMGNLNDALETLINFFNISKSLIRATATFSSSKKESKIDYEQLVSQLSAKEKTAYLIRLVNDEPRLGVLFKKRLKKMIAPVKEIPKISPSIGEIQEKEKEIIKQMQTEANKKAQAAHLRKMNKLAKDENGLWKTVYYNLNRKTGKGYDIATSYLVDLKELAKHQDNLVVFESKMKDIVAKYGRSRVLITRFEKVKLI